MLQIITIICVTHVQKKFLIRASIKQLLTKYQIFMILPQISHFHKYRNFSSLFATFKTNCFIPINFYGRDMSGILFFIFARCEPLKHAYLQGSVSIKQNKTKQTSFVICFVCCLFVVVVVFFFSYFFEEVWSQSSR